MAPLELSGQPSTSIDPVTKHHGHLGPERRTHPRVIVHDIELIGVEEGGGAV
jgi:hypothetical protein